MNKNNTKGFHIIVIDMDNNKTLVDEKTNCIIGGLHLNNSTQSIGYSKCTRKDLLETIEAAKKSISEHERLIIKHCLSEVFKKALNDEEYE